MVVVLLKYSMSFMICFLTSTIQYLLSPFSTAAPTALEFTGAASVSVYQSLLLSLTYTNLADEPTPGNRTITITLSDGLQQDMTVVIVIVVLNNDNGLVIEVPNPNLVYTEGDVSIRVGELSEISLIDQDRDSVVTSLTLTLIGALEEDNEFLVVDTTAIGGDGFIDGAVIELTETSSLANYQVGLRDSAYNMALFTNFNCHYV